MANRIQLRRDGAQQWANVNPILAQGELGIELDTSRLKIGDGVTPWNSLKYERPLETESNTADTLVKRDADGNFEAGAITASIIGNAATATRLANARSFTLTGDMSGSAQFDGSANINITAELNYQPGLPHYDSEDLDATGVYTQLTIDSRGRVVTGANPTTLAGYGITDAQTLDPEVSALAALSTIGIISRTGAGTLATRTITGQPGQLVVSNGNAQAANPLLGLADTPVVVGSYNPTGSVSLDQPETSVAESGSIHQTVNTTEFTVDRYGRLTYAQTSPISTAREGTLSPVYDNATAYSRYDKVKGTNDRLYEAILDINAGGGEPTHTDTSDTGSWRYLGSALTPQKGLASFSQEDFDVTSWDSANSVQGGYVKIADRGVDNLQLQNNRIGFADGNTVENFELDQELTATTGYRGFNYLNYVKINNTSGNLLFSANNTGDSGNGEIDINVRSYFSDPDITLDGALDQKLDKTADGNLTFQHTQNTATNRTLLINATNAGSGNALIDITSQNDISINATDVNSRVNVEDYHFQDNVLSTTNATLVLDPNDDDDVTGLVQIRGDLQVDGTTTTVNSVTTTIQDPILTLGGEDTLTVDDNKDRGVEFRYYDSQERFGFFGWDEDYANSNIWSGTGGYRFLYNATNTNEVFAGTDAPVIAGNLRLTTNTSSTWKTPTTGTLVVTGGVGVSENLNVGGTTHLNGNVEIDGTVDIDANFAVRNNTTDKFTVESSSGNTVIEGTLDVQLETEITDNLIITADAKAFTIRTAGNVEKFVVDTDNGNTVIQGTVNVINAVDFDSTLNVDNNVTFNAELDVDGNSFFHNNITLDTTGKNFKITNGTTDKFTVLSTNGNTDIRGQLDVGSAVHLESTLQVDGNITLGNQSSDTLTINSDTTITDNLTVNQSVDFDNNFNVDGTVDFNSTLVVDGQTTIFDSVILQSDNEVFNINNNAAQTQFSIDYDNGNTIIGRSGQGTGTLTVHGDSEFNDQVTFTDNVTVGNQNTDTLTVNSVSTFTDNVTINGNLTVDTNAIIEGNLTVNGSTTTVNSTVTTVDDPVMTLGGDTAPSQADAKDRGIEFRYYDNQSRVGFFGWDISAARYAFYHSATNSSEAFAGTRSGLDIGSAKLFDTTNATNSATGALIVGGGAGIGLDLYVGDDLVVGDQGSFGGDVDITGTLDLTNSFNINSGKFTVAAGSGNTYAEGTLQVDGNVTLGNQAGDAHTVTGTVQFNQALTVAERANIRNIKVATDAANEIGTLAGNLILDSAGGTVNITDNADIDGDLNVDGNTKVDGTLTVDGNTTIGNNSGDAHSVTGTVTFNQAITSTDITADAIKIGVDASNEISTTAGNLILDSDGGKVHITDNAEVDGNLQVDGNTQLGDANTDSLTVNATSTFTASITSEDITAKNIKIGVDGNSEVSTTSGNLTIDSATGQTIVDDNLEVTGNIVVDGNSTLGDASNDTLTVNATSTFNAAITSTDITADNVQIGVSGAGEIDTTTGNLTLDSAGGTVNITDNADIDGNLNVDGNAQVDGTLNVDGNATIGNNSSDAHTINGTVTFPNSVDINGTATIDNIGINTRTITADGGNLNLDASTNLVVVQGNLTIDDNVIASDNVTLGSDASDALTVNATSTFNAAITSGNITADNIQIGVAASGEIDTSTGSLTLDSATGETTIDDNLTVNGTLDVDELTTITDGLIINAANKSVNIQNGSGADQFTVDTDNGNTVIQGTLGVQSATTISNTLNVTQGVDLDSTLNVDGVTTLTETSAPDITGATYAAGGSLQLTGGASITDDLSLGNDLRVYGDVTVNGSELHKGTQDFEEKVTVSNSTNPANLTANAALMVTGGASVNQDLFVGDDFYVGPNADTKFTVLGESGNTTIVGTLNVTGQTTVGVVSASTITTSGATGIGGTFNVGTNVFTVLSGSGNTTIAGTLDVASRVIIDDTLNVTQGVDFDSTLNVDGASTFNDTITQNSTSLFKDNVVLRGASKTLILQNGSGTDKITLASTTGNITAAGLTTTNTLDVVSNTTIGGTLGVTGQITGNVTGDLTGTADKGNLIDVTDTTTSNLTYFPTFVSTNGGYTEIRTDSTNLTYNPSTNRLTVANFRSTTDFEVQGNLTITGALTFGQSQVGSIANHDTDALAEGTTNLYYTEERVDDRVAALVDGGTGISATYNDAGNLLSLAVDFGEINTNDLTEGNNNKFFTQARTRSAFTYGNGIEHDGSGGLQVTQADISTDNLTEGSTNLFYTDARGRASFSAGGDLAYNASTGEFSITKFTTANARASVSASGDLSYNSGTGAFSFTERTDAQVNSLADTRIGLQVGANLDLSSKDTDALSEGSSNLYYTDARADARVALATGANLSLANKDTGDLAEGTNLYYTNARADARIALQVGANLDISNQSTSELSEGTNLYYTNARADARVVAGITGKLDASAVSTFGGTLIDDADAAAARTTLGLGTAATTAATAYATAAQGTLAASATQPGDLGAVATSNDYDDLSNKPTLFSGAYNDLTGKPTLGTAAATAATAYATAAQGATADSALQAETITLAALKTAAANSATYAAFQAAIAAL